METINKSKLCHIRRTSGGVFGIVIFLLFIILATSPVRGEFTLTSGAATKVTVSSGHTETLKASVKSTTAISGVTVTLKILGAWGNQVARKDYLSQSFTAGKTINYTWSYAVPSALPADTYTLAVEVLSSDRKIYFANSTVDAFDVGTAWTTISPDWYTYQENTAYWALQNPWGECNVNPCLVNGKNFTQTLTANTSTFQNDTLIRFNWPNTGQTTSP